MYRLFARKLYNFYCRFLMPFCIYVYAMSIATLSQLVNIGGISEFALTRERKYTVNMQIPYLCMRIGHVNKLNNFYSRV